MRIGCANPVLAPVLEELVRRRVDTRAGAAFARALAAAASGREEFLMEFTALARLIGKAPLALSVGERERLAEQGVDWRLDGWGLDELGRVAVLVEASARWSGEALAEMLEECYRQGDNRERQAVLRSLPFLPGPERFLTLAVEACRTHVQPVFEAIACENPYPERHFPEPSFNQMVLKALFTGVALERIVGLGRRVTLELRRMAEDYASERRAAGRPVPPDIGCLIGAERSQP